MFGQSMFKKIHIENSLIWILLIVFLIHAAVVFNDFHTDDYRVLIIMETGFSLQGLESMDNLYNFRPVSNLAIYIRHWILGKSPFFWYLLNIFLHLSAVSLLYYFTKSIANKTVAIWASLFFGIYFQHYEAILWLYGIVRLLAAIFLLVTLIFHFKMMRNPSKAFLLGTYFFFTLAVFCVEDTIVFALFFSLISFFNSRYSSNQFKLYGIGFILIAVIYLACRMIILGSVNPSTAYFFIGSHVIKNIFSYTAWLIFPQLNHPYIIPFVEKFLPVLTSFTGLINIISLTIAVVTASYILLKGAKIERLALLFIAASLAPIVFFDAKVSIRHLYSASLGAAMIAGSLFCRLYSRIKPTSSKLLSGLLVIYFLCHAAAINLTINYYHYNQERVRFFIDELEKLTVDWSDFDYLLFDNVPGRVRMGHAWQYRFGLKKTLIDINQQYEYQPDLEQEKNKLKSTQTSYILIDFKSGMPEVIEKYIPDDFNHGE